MSCSGSRPARNNARLSPLLLMNGAGEGEADEIGQNDCRDQHDCDSAQAKGIQGFVAFTVGTCLFSKAKTRERRNRSEGVPFVKQNLQNWKIRDAGGLTYVSDSPVASASGSCGTAGGLVVQCRQSQYAHLPDSHGQRRVDREVGRRCHHAWETQLLETWLLAGMAQYPLPYRHINSESGDTSRQRPTAKVVGQAALPIETGISINHVQPIKW